MFHEVLGSPPELSFLLLGKELLEHIGLLSFHFSKYIFTDKRKNGYKIRGLLQNEWGG